MSLERQGIALNVASYVGLGTLLGCVQGDVLDRPDGSQIEAMKQLPRRGNGGEAGPFRPVGRIRAPAR